MCTFCAIVAGDVPAHVVFHDDFALGFLDNRPLFPGHCLLIPAEHHETLSDLPARVLPPLFATTQLLARAVEMAMNADGTLILMNNRVSQSVPHLHVHVVRRRRKDGLRGLLWPRLRYEDDRDMQVTAEAVRAAVAHLQAGGSATR